MGDDGLSQQERRWREAGTIEDEAAFLLERVRAGELTQERLELAAHCGHQGAIAATGVRPPGSLEAFIGSLDRWGAVAACRAAVGAARLVCPLWSSGIPTALQNGDWVTVALRSAETCILHRTPENERAALRASRDAFGAAGESDLEGTPQGFAADACASAARAVGKLDTEAAHEALRLAGRAEPEEQVHLRVREELIEWALGPDDPLIRCRS